MFFSVENVIKGLKASTFPHMLDVFEFSQFEVTGSEDNKTVCQQHNAAIQISRASSRVQVVKWRAKRTFREPSLPLLSAS